MGRGRFLRYGEGGGEHDPAGTRVVILGSGLSGPFWHMPVFGTVVDCREVWGTYTYSVKLDAPIDGLDVMTFRDCDLMAVDDWSVAY